MTPEFAAALLNVTPNADVEVIDEAFEALAPATRPERFAGASADELNAATARFVQLCEARDVLVILAIERTAHPEEEPPASVEPPAQLPPLSAAPTQPTVPIPAPPQPTIPVPPQPTVHTLSDSPEAALPPLWLPTSADSTNSVRRESRIPLAPLLVATGATLLVGVLIAVVIAVSAMAHFSNTGQSLSAEPASVSRTITSQVDVEQGTSCPAFEVGGCWEWTLTSSTACPRAIVTIGLASTEAGSVSRELTRAVKLRVGEPTSLRISAARSPEPFAGVEKIVCAA